MRSIGLLPAAAVVAGAMAGLAAGTGAWPPALLLPAVLAGLVVCWRRGLAIASCALLAGGFALAAAALAADAAARALHPPLRALLDRAYGGFDIQTPGPEGDHDPVDLRMTLIEDASAAGDVVAIRAAGVALRLRGIWEPLAGDGVRITVSGTLAGGRVEQWRAGRTVVAPVTFRRPARYLNAGVPDGERDLALDGTALLGSVKSGLLVEMESFGSAVQELAGRIRAHVRRAIGARVSVHDPVAGGIVTAVLIGDRTGLPLEIRDRLQAAGTYHVIAISGGNIAILAGLALLALMLAGIRGRLAALITLLVLLAYGQVVAAEPSVWRATLMAAAYLVARLIDHRTPAWHAVAAAGTVMLVVQPLDVRNPGFLLSFGATTALLGMARAAAGLFASGWSRLAAQPFWIRWCAMSFVASLAVELVVMPISASGFSRVTAAGLVLNLLAVPLMAVVQVAGMAAALLSWIEPAARVAGWLAFLAATGIVESARLVELAPWLARRVPAPGALTLIVYYGGLTLVLLWPRARFAGATLAAASALAIISGLSIAPSHAGGPGGLRLTVFDVGQGDAMVLETAGAGPLVVDTGGAAFGSSTFDIGRRVLAPALWTGGVRKIGTLLVTHADPDHVGGAGSLIEDFSPDRLWTGVPVPAHGPTMALLEDGRRGGLRLEAMRRGDTYPWGRARIRVLNPPEPDWERPQVRNDDSVVLEVIYGDAALLLTGDISAEVERDIVPLLTPARLRVLKVAHHGSRTSTSLDLVESWRPHVAVISAGRGNSFGHPTPEVLARLAGAGTEVFRTDQDGQITLESDGDGLRVGTYTGRRWVRLR